MSISTRAVVSRYNPANQSTRYGPEPDLQSVVPGAFSFLLERGYLLCASTNECCVEGLVRVLRVARLTGEDEPKATKRSRKTFSCPLTRRAEQVVVP